MDMDLFFPQEAIEFLRQCQYVPNAERSYELITGAVMWDDEQYERFVDICTDHECEYYGMLFAFRTSLIKGIPDERYRFIWEEVQLRCPEWIGFRVERTMPSPQLQEYLRRAEEDF
jgi:hypothetical protein